MDTAILLSGRVPVARYSKDPGTERYGTFRISSQSRSLNGTSLSKSVCDKVSGAGTGLAVAGPANSANDVRESSSVQRDIIFELVYGKTEEMSA